MRATLLGPVAQPVESRSSSLDGNEEGRFVFTAITAENMREMAKQVLLRANGTQPGSRLTRVQQQREWVGLLNRTWTDYETVERAQQQGQQGEALAQLERKMRESLRDLLFTSNTTNVFNFGKYLPPTSDQDLSDLVRLPQFRMLVEAVNDVHQRLERERPQPGSGVVFEDRSDDSDSVNESGRGSR